MPKENKDSKGLRFKSPLSKLVSFFKKSRDNWKKKYMKAKYRAKLLSDQVRYWKRQNAELKLQIKELKKELAESEKKTQKKTTE